MSCQAIPFQPSPHAMYLFFDLLLHIAFIMLVLLLMWAFAVFLCSEPTPTTNVSPETELPDKDQAGFKLSPTDPNIQPEQSNATSCVGSEHGIGSQYVDEMMKQTNVKTVSQYVEQDRSAMKIKFAKGKWTDLKKNK